MPLPQKRTQDIASVMEGSKGTRAVNIYPSMILYANINLGIGKFVVPYANGVASPHNLAASTIAALHFCTALAEERGNHELADTMLHLADMHQAVGERFIETGRSTMEDRVEFREGILAWYLHRAINADDEMSMKVNSDEEHTRPTKMTNHVRDLILQVRSRIKNDGAGNYEFKQEGLNKELRSEARLGTMSALKPSRPFDEQWVEGRLDKDTK
ncbi:hypothetical protein P171DRAFT_28201 [Karstenula rhodostoma CBS 690.94]|uniref:Uncharacterized protein n=1 Tax=Karstenula rhodostoma CBS 690.94 TaxID=1392251 RepID=A0A9P4PJA8_9PLEO|nr:hypothetical protein P171DRAFT_28201 [Karstenula rhodostoma CBS 690.94]